MQEYNGWNKIHTGGEYTYELDTSNCSTVNAELLGFKLASITIEASPDYAGTLSFETQQGNSKNRGFALPSGTLTPSAGGNAGAFGIELSGRYLILKKIGIIVSGKITIKIVGKR